jgi:hypothetical protein
MSSVTNRSFFLDSETQLPTEIQNYYFELETRISKTAISKSGRIFPCYSKMMARSKKATCELSNSLS